MSEGRASTAPVRTIHVYGAFGEVLREPVQAAFPEREIAVWSRPEEFVAGLGAVEVLLAHDVPRGHWRRAERLRLIQVSGAGVDRVLPAPDLPDRVRLTSARGIHEPEMSEFVLAQILALAKRIPRALEQQRAHRWQLYASRPLAGATLGVLGLGAIGQGVAQRGAALGMRVIGVKRTPEPVPGVERVHGPDGVRDVLAASDVVVVVLPLTEETRGLLGAEALATMKPRAHLVNVARGGIVDEEALADALREGRLGAAALDVFAEEPLPAESPLWDAPNLLVTPHAAGTTRDYLRRLCDVFIENVRRLERGEPLRNLIDRERGY